MSNLPALQPYDEHNQRLKANVHPDDWTNPIATGRYNLVVIGAGTAGLVTASIAAGLGGKVALIERDLMGGDCLNVGCVPSKGIISAARVAATVRDAAQFGINVPENWNVDFAQAMMRMRKLRADISPADSVERFTEKGVEVFLGDAKFIDENSVEVGGQKLTFKKAVITTGARAAKLPIPGLDEISPLTNETIFSLTEAPERLIVIGGGPIGTEMAQTFARLGSQVIQIEMQSHILGREEEDAARIVQKSLERDGVEFVLNAETIRCEQRGADKVVVVKQDGEEREVIGDQVLVGIGRTPNVDSLGLENAGVKFDTLHGVEVNDRLQTTNPCIYAAGDVCSKYKFTHSADFMARLVVRNALFMGRGKVSNLVIPWATFTSPEIAHVGIYPEEAKSQGIEIDTFTQEMAEVDRAILEGETEGFVRVHVKRGTDKILGATVVATNAGDLIGELSLAITHNVGLGKIGAAIHPYPTQAEAIRRLGDQYGRTRFTPFIAKLFKGWLNWTR